MGGLEFPENESAMMLLSVVIKDVAKIMLRSCAKVIDAQTASVKSLV